MLFYLENLKDIWGPFRLFEYVTFRAGGAAMTSMIICFIFGPITVKLLKKFNSFSPGRHKGLIDEKFIDKSKDKVPSMGGILIVFAITLSTLIWAKISNPLIFVFLGILISLAVLGFIDDYFKAAKKKRDGISSKLKLLCQLVIALSAVIFLHIIEGGDYLRELWLPFFKTPLLSGTYGVYTTFFIAVLAIIASSNAVNLTDGKDGLASGTLIFRTLAYSVFAYLCGHIVFADYLGIPFIPGAGEIVVFAASMLGALIGFLWYNCYPASMFMGDTGSLALGGSIAMIAVLVRQEIVLPIIGGVFVMEAGSVLIQIISFKLTGKRIFLCTPIHHHFEQKGWTETQIVVRFWILAGIFAMIGLATLKLR